MLVKLEMVDSEIRQAVAWYIQHRYGVIVSNSLYVSAKPNSLPGEKPGEYRDCDLRLEVAVVASEKAGITP